MKSIKNPLIEKAISKALSHFKPITATPKDPNPKPYPFQLDMFSTLQLKSFSKKSKPIDHNEFVSPYIAMGIGQCLHTHLKTYVGFTESYQYCSRCDKKIE